MLHKLHSWAINIERERKAEIKTRKLENKKKKSLEIEKGLVDGS